jgi:hypothetical protein
MPTLKTAPLPTFTSTSDNLFVQSTGNITYNDSIKSLSLPTIIKAPQLSLNFPNPFFGPANRYDLSRPSKLKYGVINRTGRSPCLYGLFSAFHTCKFPKKTQVWPDRYTAP